MGKATVVNGIKKVALFESVDPYTRTTYVFNSTFLSYSQQDSARYGLFRLHLRYRARKQYPTNFDVCWSI